MRTPARPPAAAAAAAGGVDVIWPVAVAPLGKRSAAAPTVRELLDSGAGVLSGDLSGDVTGLVVALDHAGPQAAAWSAERALGPDEEPDPLTGRRPRALDEDGWRAIEEQYAAAAALCRERGIRTVLAVDDDGLLHCTLRAAASAGARNRASDPARLGAARVLAIHRAVGGGDVMLAVEDLAPQGIDATDGVAYARAFVAQGAARIYATAGTCALPVLRRREGGARHMLASAAWLKGRVNADVIALVPSADVGGLVENGALVENGVRL